MAAKRRKGPEINEDTKNQLIGAVNAGQSIAKAARHYRINESTARNIVQKYRKTGSVENLPRSGRPTALTDADKRQFVRAAQSHRRKALTELGNELGLDVDEKTLRNALKERNYHRRVARKVPYLTKNHLQLRMSWARLYRSFTRQKWRKVIWSDECYVQLGDQHGRIFVTRRPGEEFLEECLVGTFNQSPVRVMVWGCIMEGKKGPLRVLDFPGGRGGGMNTKRYCEQVLEGALKDFHSQMSRSRGKVLFQQDNATCHTSKAAKKWLGDHNIPLLFHPPNSPDLSPIERVWHELKTIIRGLFPQPSNSEQQSTTLGSHWILKISTSMC
ncbi:hypothetical protein D9619_003837 [Psilocybe cf. subviscida]|uniref:Transposase n=1 Tax=Psilocybe cf. subviscida TaxID=2480587 RepID=A0A8H5AWW2_9AGAR|nr:hypothetical protein D9619_003837 [Psilocybe cf. subviscida]